MMKRLLISVFCLATLWASAQEFGYFNRQEIFQMMPETQEATKKMDQLAKSYEDELLAMQTEYQKKGAEFLAQRDSLPESILTRRMTEIQSLEERIQNFYRDSQTDLQKKEQELILPINEKLMKAVAAVGEELGLVYIFDISMPQSPLMYYSKSKCKDVTSAIRNKLGLK